MDTERAWRLEDVYELHRIVGISLSPDGRRVVYVQDEALPSEDTRHTSLWLTRAGDTVPHRLTRHKGSDSRPLWSPDGTRLAFLSDRPWEAEIVEATSPQSSSGTPMPSAEDGENREEAGRTQLWVMDLSVGGEPRQVTARPEGIGRFTWAPDGKILVFEARDPTEEETRYLKSLKAKHPGPFVLTRMQHKADLKIWRTLSGNMRFVGRLCPLP